MTTNDVAAPEMSAELEANLQKIETLTQRLMSALSHKKQINPSLHGPDATLYGKALQAYWQEWMQNPAKILEHQIEYWGKSVTHYVEAQQALAKGKLQPPADPGPKDRRFKNPLWDEHPYFNFIKQQYLINAEAIRNAVDDVEDMDATEKKRLRYFAQQIVDMFAPTNFFATNPDALQKALETEGESLVKGLENLVADLEANNGELVVRLADEGAFEIRCQHRHSRGRGHLSQSHDGSDPVRADHGESARNPHRPVPALDQQVLHSGPEARKFVHPLGGGPGLHPVCDQLDQPG